ncbi:hypothetical protein Tco_0181347, partial [Tanacetum coccineum]
GAKDLEQKRLKKKVVKETLKKEDTTKVPAKVDVTEQGTQKRKGGHMKMIARKRKRPQSDVDSNDEHRECLKIVTFEDGDYLVIYRANGNFRANETLASPKANGFGKNKSNPLIVGSLLKTT